MTAAAAQPKKEWTQLLIVGFQELRDPRGRPVVPYQRLPIPKRRVARSRLYVPSKGQQQQPQETETEARLNDAWTDPGTPEWRDPIRQGLDMVEWLQMWNFLTDFDQDCRKHDRAEAKRRRKDQRSSRYSFSRRSTDMWLRSDGAERATRPVDTSLNTKSISGSGEAEGCQGTGFQHDNSRSYSMTGKSRTTLLPGMACGQRAEDARKTRGRSLASVVGCTGYGAPRVTRAAKRRRLEEARGSDGVGGCKH